MIAVSAEAWHAILHLITPWQYPPRLGILIYILSRLGSIRRGLAFYPRSYHAFAVSAEAISYHALRPWQYPLRLGFLSYILSRLGSIRRGLAFYSRSYHAFTVSAEAISYHALADLPRLITTWQYPPRLYLITPRQYLPRYFYAGFFFAQF